MSFSAPFYTVLAGMQMMTSFADVIPVPQALYKAFAAGSNMAWVSGSPKEEGMDILYELGQVNALVANKQLTARGLHSQSHLQLSTDGLLGKEKFTPTTFLPKMLPEIIE
jgi:hypothetical protein